MKRNIKILSLIGISMFICIISVSAIGRLVPFSFSSVGQSQDTIQELDDGTAVLRADLFRTGKATMGLSLSKSGFFGWNFISRCNKSIEGKTSVDCTWEDQKNGTYKGTIVLNTKDASFNNSVTGEFILYTK